MIKGIDPRNYNLKKHMVRLAVYEDSMKWLNDAANCDSIHRFHARSMKQRSQSPIGNWLHSRTTTTHIATRGWSNYGNDIFVNPKHGN